MLLFGNTGGVVNVYQDYLFSMHMVGHMLLTMAIPVLLVAGAPVTLAARAIRKRDDGTRGGREWILWAVHSPVARILTNPFVAAALFIGSLWVFYYTDLFRWSLYDHLGHQWMIAHFLITGYLFALSLIGIDPVPLRLPEPVPLPVPLCAPFGTAMGQSLYLAGAVLVVGLVAALFFAALIPAARVWGAEGAAAMQLVGNALWLAACLVVALGAVRPQPIQRQAAT